MKGLVSWTINVEIIKFLKRLAKKNKSSVSGTANEILEKEMKKKK